MPYRFRILVVDDEPAQRELVAGFLKKQAFDVVVAETGAKAVELFRQDSIDLILTDQKMPNMSGLDLLQAVRAINPEIPVILMTAFGSIEAAVSAIQGGATDYLIKPLNLNELLYRIRQVSDRYRIIAENRELREALQSRHRIEGIIGESGHMLEVVSLVHRVAPSEATVLIRGESGTGKELIAKAIHFASPRASGPLVKVNCAALPETLLESELFGHEKGAFTGAISQKVGRLELADQGTLFLDEVGDIPLEIQPKLLRALQEREFERLGSTHTKKVNVRLVAATNRDLEKMIAEREFRSDLYYRLNVFPIRIPPLRERREDIPLLVRYFVQKSARQMQKQIETIPAAAMKTLTNWDWPGNIRELENFIERAVILTRGRSLELPLAELSKPKTKMGAPVGSSPSGQHDIGRIVRETLSEMSNGGLKGAVREYDKHQRQEITRFLAETKGRVGGSDGAAARMGINRTTLLSRMKKLGIYAKQFS